MDHARQRASGAPDQAQPGVARPLADDFRPPRAATAAADCPHPRPGGPSAPHAAHEASGYDQLAVRPVGEAEFERLREPWNDLLARSEVDHAFLTWEWLYSWWETYHPGRELLVLRVDAGDRLVGLLPLLRRPVRCLGMVPCWRLEWLGSGEGETDETCTEYLDAILDPACPDAALQAAGKYLTSRAAPCWHDAEFLRCRTLRLAEALRAALDFEPCTELRGPVTCPWIELPGTFVDYLEQLSGNTRQQLRRGLRDLERRAWALEEAQSFPEAEAFLAELMDLHQRRWEAAGRAGAFASPRFRTFLHAATRRLMEFGALSLLRLRIAGQTAGCLYNVRYRGEVSFYQSGFDLERFADLKPGILMHALAIRQAIERGDHTYDFLGGAARYKTSLATRERELCGIRLARAPGRDRLYRVHRLAVRLARAGVARLRRWRQPLAGARRVAGAP